MSGHSKWSTIKRKKGSEDAKRSAKFTKLARAIMVAVSEGKSGDPTANFALKAAIQRARADRMPQANIKRAIDRGLGKGEGGAVLKTFRLEGYGPGGVAIMVDVVTDNRNQAVSGVRSSFSKCGGSLGGSGSAAYIFGDTPSNPQFTVPVTNPAEVKKVTLLLKSLESLDDVQHVYSNLATEN